VVEHGTKFKEKNIVKRAKFLTRRKAKNVGVESIAFPGKDDDW